MFNTILKATENFCTHQIREPFEIINTIDAEDLIITYIDITANDAKHRVYVVSNIAFAQKVSKLFLEEDESNEETLIDMTLETTNLIVGSAKVIAQESDVDTFNIETPHFTHLGEFQHLYDAKQIYNLNDSKILIAIKAIDGRD